MMRTSTTRSAVAAVLGLLATLTACSSDSDTSSKETTESPTTAKASTSSSPESKPSVDCSDQDLDQATWVKNCGDGAGTGGDGTDGQTTGLKFGSTYTWPDGLKVTIVDAKVYTDYNTDVGESPSPGAIDFRIRLKFTNSGKTPADLSKVSTIVEGATNGGEAAGTALQNGSEPLEGRLAPGVTVTKTDDKELETKYGRKIVVTVQRASDDLTQEFPEFTGTITG